ncbi:hypothetical protein LCGC14_2349570 [marine sediment metagenome]|uniref:Uncharacterized protein n=1 Tax=marine sediment metagenome TaxID=412755 RepID=A0A0F9F4N3_9ZZZZ
MEELLIEQGSVEIEEICLIKATNRQALIAGINSFFMDSDWFDGNKGKIYLHVGLSYGGLGCEGCSADYATEADVPYHSVPCSCGNPRHWLIKYEEG